MTIEVTRLDRTMVFPDRETLARHVEELIRDRGGIFAPMELACIQRLAEMSNGNAPAGVHRIAREALHYTPARPERGESPFDDRIEELRADLEARQAEHDELNASIRTQEREAEAERRKRIAKAEGHPDKLMALGRWVDRRTMELEAARAQRQALHDAVRRALVMHRAIVLRRDQWHADRQARFVVEGRVVDMAGLHEWLASRPGR